MTAMISVHVQVEGFDFREILCMLLAEIVYLEKNIVKVERIDFSKIKEKNKNHTEFILKIK